MDIGPGELIVVVAIIALLFGAKKLPELARSIGQAKAEFERGARGEAEPADEAPRAERA